MKRITREEVIDKFHSSYVVSLVTGCWEWIKATNEDGYGTIYVGLGKHVKAHRFSYELYNQLIPKGLEIDHICGIRCCVNPQHLEIVTHIANILRSNCPPAINARKTKCIRGHTFSIHNTYYETTGRRCRLCHSMKMKNLRIKRKHNEIANIFTN